METATGLEVILRTAHGSGLTLQALTLIMTTVPALINALSNHPVTMDQAGQVLIAAHQVMSITLSVSKCFNSYKQFKESKTMKQTEDFLNVFTV